MTERPFPDFDINPRRIEVVPSALDKLDPGVGHPVIPADINDGQRAEAGGGTSEEVVVVDFHINPVRIIVPDTDFTINPMLRVPNVDFDINPVLRAPTTYDLDINPIRRAPQDFTINPIRRRPQP